MKHFFRECRTAKCKTAEPQKGRLKVALFLLLAFYFSLSASIASAQVGNCEPALGEAVLDAGNVRAKILNNGRLFSSRTSAFYEVPKGSGKRIKIAASLWIVGLIDGQLRGAASFHGIGEFWAGPIDQNGNPPALCKNYDKIWELRTEDLVSFQKTGAISTNLKNWPWHLGAPVVDGDGNLDNYDLEGGDLPELLGDQRLWWIMNDRGNEHLETKTKPIGLEVHGSAHAFNHNGFIRNTTFYEYQFINKNQKEFQEAYLGIYTDLGNNTRDDDYTGSDSLLHLGYSYNADNFDENQQGWPGYQSSPPAFGITTISTANADHDGLDNDRDGETDEIDEKLGSTGYINLFSDGSIGFPNTAADYYLNLQSRWKDGKPFTFGGTGRDFSDQPIKFMYPGDPVLREGWTEYNPDPVNNRIGPLEPGERFTATTSGPFSIPPGDTLNARFAVVWSRGTSNLDSVSELKKDVRSILNGQDVFFAPIPIDTPNTLITSQYKLGFSQNFPNPFDQSTTIRYSLPQSMQVRLVVYDILGREVEILVDQPQDAGIYTVNFEAGTLPTGIYMARIELDHLRFTKRMVLAR